MAPPTMLMISKEEAIGGDCLSWPNDKLKMLGNMILMKNCNRMRIHIPAALALSDTNKHKTMQMLA